MTLTEFAGLAIRFDCAECNSAPFSQVSVMQDEGLRGILHNRNGKKVGTEQISTHHHFAIHDNYCRVGKNRKVEDLYEKYMGYPYSCRVDSGDDRAVAIVLTKGVFLIG
jgi:hypothetical protein